VETVVMSALPTPAELEVPTLGPARHRSPLAGGPSCVDERDRVLVPADTAVIDALLAAGQPLPSFERAGPRADLFFDPATLGCGILTCGGLCPGLNDVIRSIVLSLTYAYGVRRILGFRYGYAGLAADAPVEPMPLTPAVVENIHEHGGTLLGSSRGPQDLDAMVDTLVRHDLSVLFVVGGDGGLRGASALRAVIARRGLPIAVVGVPKTIDNDLSWISRSFGFATAVDEAAAVVTAAHEEARGAWNGVGLVKLMGRQAGFIAVGATLANCDVNFCLIPEVPFALEGGGGFLEVLEARLDAKHHAVVVVAEGAGQDLMAADAESVRDVSGNVKLRDVGVFLRERIGTYLAARGKASPIRYIDPSYTIRSQPTNAFDAQLCLVLGQHAVHAGLAGKTDVVVGVWNQRFTHVPIPLVVHERRQVDPRSDVWQRVLEATGQPASMAGA
jgi:6-phosphofructokinase 1